MKTLQEIREKLREIVKENDPNYTHRTQAARHGLSVLKRADVADAASYKDAMEQEAQKHVVIVVSNQGNNLDGHNNLANWLQNWATLAE